VALAHEWLEARAGSEKTFEALAGIFPDADLYAMTNELGGSFAGGGRAVHTTFLARLPVLRRRRDLALPLMPLAWRTVTRQRYDLVVTSSHACVKGFAPGRHALHLCYCHTPMRYVWDPHDQRRGAQRLAVAGPGPLLRRWDRRSARWVDGFAANSRAVQERIERCYGRPSRLIPPPVDTDFFTPGGTGGHAAGLPLPPFVLACSRFIPYKRLDLAIQAADRAGVPLVVAGRGPEEPALRTLAATARVPVQFELAPSDERLRALYRAAAAFVFPALEDFGIVAVEAQACGTPVVGLSRGGAADTVVDGLTGVLVEDQEADAMAGALLRALELSDADACVRQAARFSYGAFSEKVLGWVEEAEQGRF
jgi:glycosyltransferase involved in cell wall biosynthesis